MPETTCSIDQLRALEERPPAIKRSAVKVRGLEIEITQAGEVIGKSITNALGELFAERAKGSYEIQVVLADTMVKLPPYR